MVKKLLSHVLGGRGRLPGSAPVCMARTTNKRVISSGNLYSYLLPQCEALRACRSGFLIATLLSGSFESKVNVEIFLGKLSLLS